MHPITPTTVTLRRLADRVAELVALPCQRETAAAWTRLNRRQPGRPWCGSTKFRGMR